MKYLLLLLSMISTVSYGQLTTDAARTLFYSYKIGSYDYHEQFIGHAGYGAPLILTSGGGAAFFGGSGDSTGNYGLAVKIDSAGKELWQRRIYPQFDEIETQSIVEDANGDFYVFMLSFDQKKYRGGCERIVHLDGDGEIIWDRIISDCTRLNNPVVAYILALDDGRISLRGHVATRVPQEGGDPEYHFWEGWLSSDGSLEQKTGDVIIWEKTEWQQFFEPATGDRQKE
jgi:hypothetical protein